MKKAISIFILVCFIATGQIGTCPVYAQDFVLPTPGMMVHLSPEFNPPILKGIKVHTDNPFRFDFILDKGDSKEASAQLKEESTKLIKYFLASLTIPEKDLWVNLSPYEKDRIVPESFGQTEMGRDLLAQDYILKQITASLIYPEDEIGKKFWKRIYEEAQTKYHTTNIPVNTFNKVWIVPEKAVIYENAKAGTAYVVESRLKVMLEQDYLSLEKHEGSTTPGPGKETNQLGSQIVREIVIPELTKEVNEGKNFSQLRQVYHSLILATWYKKKIKDSILSQVYTDKNKVQGINIDDPKEKERIYQQYLQAFKKGAYNYIKEEIDPVTQQAIPKKYFSGGVGLRWGIDGAMTVVDTFDSAQLIADSIQVMADLAPEQRSDKAMNGRDDPEKVLRTIRTKKGETIIELSKVAAEDIDHLSRWKESVGESREAIARIKDRLRDDRWFESYSEPFFSGDFEQYFFWTFEHLSDPNIGWTLHEKQSLALHMIDFLSILAGKSEGDVSRRDNKSSKFQSLNFSSRNPEVLKSWWFILIYLMNIENTLRTEPSNPDTKFHQETIQKGYQYVLYCLNNYLIKGMFEEHPKNVWEDMFFERYSEYSALLEEIRIFFDSWDEWIKTGERVSDQVKMASYESVEKAYTNQDGWFPSDPFEGIDLSTDFEKRLERVLESQQEMSHLREAIDPQNSNEIDAWQGNSVFWDKVTRNIDRVVLSFDDSWHIDSSRQRIESFQIHWFKEMGRRGFKQWVLVGASSDVHLSTLTEWLMSVKKEFNPQELYKRIQDYFNINDSVPPLAEWLNLPARGPEEVQNALVFFNQLWLAKKEYKAEVVFSRFNDSFNQWISRNTSKTAFLGFLRPQDYPAFYALDREKTLWVNQQLSKEHFDHEYHAFMPYGLIGHVVHELGRTHGWGEEYSIGVPIRKNQALIRMFGDKGPMAHLGKSFWHSFDLSDLYHIPESQNSYLDVVVVTSNSNEDNDRREKFPEPDPVGNRTNDFSLSNSAMLSQDKMVLKDRAMKIRDSTQLSRTADGTIAMGGNEVSNDENNHLTISSEDATKDEERFKKGTYSNHQGSSLIMGAIEAFRKNPKNINLR